MNGNIIFLLFYVHFKHFRNILLPDILPQIPFTICKITKEMDKNKSVKDVNDIVEEFNPRAMEDRMQYKKVYQIIENYIADNSDNNTSPSAEKNGAIILGGSYSVALLLDKPISRDDFVYTLYSTSAFNHANALINKIAEELENEEKGDSKWAIFLKTVLPYQRFDILVDQRVLARFNTIMANKDVIQPLSINGSITGRSINIMPPKFHLIEIYRTLYSPAEVDNWQSSLKDERRLFSYMQKIIDLTAAGKSIDLRATPAISPESVPSPISIASEAIEAVDGGAEDGTAITRNQRDQLSLAIMKSFVTNNQDVILIGEHAISALAQINVDTNIIQCIVNPQLGHDNIIAKLTVICHTVLGQKYPLHTTSRDVQVVGDFRLRRISVRLGSKDDAKEIMYIYTSSAYDLIPFNRLMSTIGERKNKNGGNEKKDEKNVLQIGNPFVLARFCLVELWTLNQVLASGTIDAGFIASRTNSMISKIMALRKKMSGTRSSLSESLLEPGNSLQIFQSTTDSYIGIYDSDETAIKTKAISSGKKFYDYFPQEWKKNKGTYRGFDSSDRDQKNE